MKFVVDTNVLLTFFWSKSIFKKLSIKQGLKLYSPEYALEEINKYIEEILKKTKLSKDEFIRLRRELAIIVEFVPLEEYHQFLKQVEILSKNLSNSEKIEFLDDIDFLALALKMNCSIWSNDKLLKKQEKINIFNTKEIINLMD